MRERTAFPARRVEGVLRVHRPDTEWLSTGWNGGHRIADCAYNVSVPEGWNCRCLEAYAARRLERAGVDEGDDGHVLFTGVDLEHARGARCGSVTVFATAGVSNPAALPMDPPGGTLSDGGLGGKSKEGRRWHEERNRIEERAGARDVGTVNLVVGTTRALEGGALVNLIAVAAEAKAATLLAETGFPGTTTDAIVVGHDPSGPPADFSGSATPVGAATRACVREAIVSSLRSRYEGTGTERPASVADAAYGLSTDVRAEVFRPARGDSSTVEREN